MHKWSFVGIANPGNHPALIAVCAQCGVVRSTTVVIGGSETTIKLDGTCTGRPGVNRTAVGF